MARFRRVVIESICVLESQIEVSRKLGRLVDEVEELRADADLPKVRIKTLEIGS